MKQTRTQLKGKVENSTITAKDFNTPLSIMNRIIYLINKKIEDLNNTN